jgi:ATP-dependent Clp protease ATP-binding subunit ClpA
MGEVSVRELIERVQQRSGSTDPLALLAAAVTMAAETGAAADALVEHYVSAARAAGLSWTLIGERLGVSKQAARQRFALRLPAGDLRGAAPEDLPMVPRLSVCVQAATAAARDEDSALGTQHLLLGLLQAGLAANVLDRLGVTREKVRDAAARLFAPVVITVDGREQRVVGDGQGDSALAGARRLAAGRGHCELRTEHLLFCIALDPGSAARRILNDLAVDPARVKRELEQCVAPVPKRHAARRGKATQGGCSFCGSSGTGPLVAGPGVRICGNCLQICLDILRPEHSGTAASATTPPARFPA